MLANEKGNKYNNKKGKVVPEVECNVILYNLEQCPECHVIREKLAELQITYVCINVSRDKKTRQDVFSLTGQYFVPVLIDKNEVLTAQDNILEYLVTKYGHDMSKPLRY
jgi:mycoredoxin